MLFSKKKPTGLAGGSSQAGITLIVPANALRKKETHRPSRWFFSSGYNPNSASERLKGV